MTNEHEFYFLYRIFGMIASGAAYILIISTINWENLFYLTSKLIFLENSSSLINLSILFLSFFTELLSYCHENTKNNWRKTPTSHKVYNVLCIFLCIIVIFTLAFIFAFKRCSVWLFIILIILGVLFPLRYFFPIIYHLLTFVFNDRQKEEG